MQSGVGSVWQTAIGTVWRVRSLVFGQLVLGRTRQAGKVRQVLDIRGCPYPRRVEFIAIERIVRQRNCQLRPQALKLPLLQHFAPERFVRPVVHVFGLSQLNHLRRNLLIAMSISAGEDHV